MHVVPLASPTVGAKVPDRGTRGIPGIVALGVALIERFGVLFANAWQ